MVCLLFCLAQTTLAASPLDGSPGPISAEQLRELNLAIVPRAGDGEGA